MIRIDIWCERLKVISLWWICDLLGVEIGCLFNIFLMIVNVVLKIGIFKIIIGIMILNNVMFLYRFNNERIEILYFKKSEFVFFIKIFVGWKL